LCWKRRPDSCLTFLIADVNEECRRRARLVWTLRRENQESEVPDSMGIRRQTRKTARVRIEVITRLG
jgi:hypothetical protein